VAAVKSRIDFRAAFYADGKLAAEVPNTSHSIVAMRFVAAALYAAPARSISVHRARTEGLKQRLIASSV